MPWPITANASTALPSLLSSVPQLEPALRLLRREDHGASGTFISNGQSTTAEHVSVCTMSRTERCDLSGMAPDSPWLVRPGGKTRCIFTTTTPYQFEVIRGDRDKLLLFFQGGGACWDEPSTSFPACSTGAFPQGTRGGVFDRANPDNPFRAYTIAHVLYCDGSVFGGNVTRHYRDPSGSPVRQAGYENARSVLDWVYGQQAAAGTLASPLASLVVSGCSAGSIGAQIWADHALNRLPHVAAAVVPDSYAGVFPSSGEGRLIAELGFCSSPLLAPLPAHLREACLARTLSLHAVTAAVTARYGAVAFAHVQSKTDDVQQAFNVALSAARSIEPSGCFDAETCFTGPDRLYAATNDYFELYNAAPNHVHFFVQSSEHCYLPNDLVYTADPSGASGG
eukprot:CAMPEP_0202760368 /NCGR_PEP_ID=MMETSP1388-20130828/18325_1 /ASSEMBLY_ACC=CAM_ASM_000864 /TAXON_ID=37098 /ORGANISM="Isochrysis sp, Strain CCMP1244" /LENGTH=394 /DNA_ID=CAMNT_0049428407 /DNA_START=59 /DNA_END=1240 /DNA_ORIENTATION=-